MNKLLKKYNLELNIERNNSGWLKESNKTNKAGQILREIFFHEASIFNIKQLIKEFILVKYNINKSFSYYTDVTQGSILVKNQKVYLTTNEDENEERRINNSYDIIPIEEFEELIMEIHSLAKKTMNDREKKIEAIKYKIDEFYSRNGIDEIGKVDYQQNSVRCIFDNYKYEINITKEGILKYSINDMTKNFRNDMKIFSEMDLGKTLLEFVNTARPNKQWNQ